MATSQKPKHKTITVTLNERPVEMQDDKPTGLEIKESAIEQGVAIQLDFILVEERPQGSTRIIGDREEVRITDKSRFTANAGDDNS